MSKQSIALDLVLPQLPELQDDCLSRLMGLMSEAKGVQLVHLAVEGAERPMLCVHYEPDKISLAQVERLARAAGAELTKRYGHAVLALHAVDGEDAARRIEALLLAEEGVKAASVNVAAQRARVEFDRSKVTLEALMATLRSTGYAPSEAPPLILRRPGWYAANKELVWSLIAGAALLLGWAGARWFGLPYAAEIGLYLVAYGFGAWDVLGHVLGALRKGRFTLDIDVLMLVAALGAAVLGEWSEGAFLLFLFSFAHALEHFALGRAREAIRTLSDLAPQKARVRYGPREEEVPVDRVVVGDVVLVHPAERIPVDGVIRSGRSAVNQAPITGESVPVEKAPGSPVFAGTVNGEGALELVVTRLAGERTLDRMISMVEEAQTQKAPTQRFADRFEGIFVPAVLTLAVLVIIIPPLLGLWEWNTSFYRGMALLVAASPCALALGTPAAVLAGIAQAARNGVLIKGGAHLERLGSIQAFALDKTGTITTGKAMVTDLVPTDGATRDELLRVTAAVERKSQHPLAEAVVRRASDSKLDLPEAGDLQSITGRGIRSSIAGTRVEVGSLRLWDEEGLRIPDTIVDAVDSLRAQGRSTLVVRYGDRWLGVLGVADRPRTEIPTTLDALRGLGIRPLVMLTGDNRGVADAIGREIGMDRVLADLLPENKVAAIEKLRSRYGQVAMVGDGVNDAPALAKATVGIAMGGAGTAAALETADMVLMADDLGRLPFAVGLSRMTRTIIRQNLYFSLAVIVLLLATTVSGVFGIGAAVFVHESSTLVVIANALRLLGYRVPHAAR